MTVPRRGRVWRIVLATGAAGVVWTGVLVGGTLEGWWRRPLAPRDDRPAFLQAATAEIDRSRRGNVALVLLEDGAVVGEHFTSVGRRVDRDTLFQVASLSKWITAWGVMTLVEAGRIDLDVPVSAYLTRWELPPTAFDNRGVTVRRLLSHTAGLTDGLGYGGFAPGQTVQSLVESLTRATDASPGADGAVRVGIEPGSAFAADGSRRCGLLAVSTAAAAIASIVIPLPPAFAGVVATTNPSRARGPASHSYIVRGGVGRSSRYGVDRKSRLRRA